MASIVVAGDTSGSITLAAPAVAGSNTLTLPALTGTVLTSASSQSAFPTGIAGTGPAFSAYASANQTVSNSTFTKLQANTEEFDTASCYDNSTNYRFTPNVAGYYQVNGSINMTSSNNTDVLCVIYKNGSAAKWGNYATRASFATDQGSVASALIYCNGTTDYLELFGYITGTGTLQFIGSQARTYFQASMVRAA